jgi:hypothetical protein
MTTNFDLDNLTINDVKEYILNISKEDTNFGKVISSILRGEITSNQGLHKLYTKEEILMYYDNSDDENDSSLKIENDIHVKEKKEESSNITETFDGKKEDEDCELEEEEEEENDDVLEEEEEEENDDVLEEEEEEENDDVFEEEEEEENDDVLEEEEEEEENDDIIENIGDNKKTSNFDDGDEDEDEKLEEW